ncbi:MAG: hypothetical protein R3C14_10830 [Caldilineaceae bacterium]
MATQQNGSWPIYVEDQNGHRIYLTWERWDHALGHPGMEEEFLDALLDTLRTGGRKQDPFDPAKYKYTRRFSNLPMPYTHREVVVKFSWNESGAVNNFVLTAYLVAKW